MAAFGLRPEDVPEQFEIEMWPDTAPAIRLFCDMATQWRPDRTGLDYSALPAVMRLRGIPRSKQADVFEDLRLLESVALNEIHKDRPA